MTSSTETEQEWFLHQFQCINSEMSNHFLIQKFKSFGIPTDESIIMINFSAAEHV